MVPKVFEPLKFYCTCLSYSFILLFVSENPCPQQGSILSIRLSESKELVTQLNQTQKEMIVDTFFQMNYSTGEWKRVKKFREVDDSIL